MANGHILVVDDERGILKSLEGILSDEGFQVSKAMEGHQALEIVLSDAPPDLILLDIWIPGMDGLELLKEIKALRSDIEIVMMSGHGNIDTAVKATKLGAFDFIEKPLSLENVLLTVHHALAQKKLLKKGAQLERHLSSRGEIIGGSPHIQEIQQFIAQAALEEGNILFCGEEGTGKEFIARAIHQQSPRKEGPFIKVNCAHWSSTLMEGLLFGVQKRSSPSIDSWGEGRLQAAAGGTLFLALVDELAAEVQGGLCLALQETKVRRIGSRMALSLDVRVIASSSGELSHRVAAGGFSHGLFGCLGERIFRTLPLRERRADIPLLLRYFLEEYSREMALPSKEISPSALELLARYDWPGNVKELKNLVKKMVLETSRSLIELKDLPSPLRGLPGGPEGQPIGKGAGKAAVHGLGWTSKGEGRMGERSGPAKRLPSSLSPQRTLSRSVVLCGQGLHSGIKSGMILIPLPPCSGIHFGDISTGHTIPAHLDYVDSTQYATVLKRGTTYARTVEHLMAALHIYGIHNLLVKISDEVPIMDGSAQEFCRLIEDGGIEEQEAVMEALIIDDCYTAGDPQTGRTISLEPYQGLAIQFLLELPPPIGRQELTYIAQGVEDFRTQIAPARTFVFLKEVEYLEGKGLTKGGRLNNVILLDPERVINTSLRFPDEFVRHKILDILGDLYLLGRPIRGRITARMTGHTENLQLLQQIRHLAGGSPRPGGAP
ncbi:MAG: UDP-3-O-[3-hydroxymyristoyl] N-acetylglucosamine deacetylase [Candidatus Tectomicrobia bacterium]|uniref:UDP-3-O-acyl-N-acetylglucosamine deacetylase n=1 Tax=Tectimicrobiota bacterium TaxID=2528274 RepID=A0A932FWC1_UNCTE|nr:UDP-3-O-[3-hydroxymyristoyl] N-acetylglucosamine deacetylase [Candidatus Tectomicrobia bacterium]